LQQPAKQQTTMLVELDEEHIKCSICAIKFSSDRDNQDLEIRKHLPVISSSQTCDHWFCHGCVLREQLRVAEQNNGRIPKWIKCMHCRASTSFNPAEPKYHRLLIDLLARAQIYAAAQVKLEDRVQESADAQLNLGTSIKRENKVDEREVKRLKLMTPSPPLVRVKEEPVECDDQYDPPPLLESPFTSELNQLVADPTNLLLCSTCKTSKTLGCFSKKQKKQGDAAQCKECIITKHSMLCSSCKVVKSLKWFSKTQRKQGKGKVATCKECKTALNKSVEELEERRCAHCKIVKKKDDVEIGHRSKGKASICSGCLKEKAQKREAERAALLAPDTERRCCGCKLTKSPSCFSITQLSKKNDSMLCKVCILFMRARPCSREEAKSVFEQDDYLWQQATEAERDDWILHSFFELPKERLCTACGVTKPLDCFSGEMHILIPRDRPEICVKCNSCKKKSKKQKRKLRRRLKNETAK